MPVTKPTLPRRSGPKTSPVSHRSKAKPRRNAPKTHRADLTNKQKKFIAHYVATLNASAAARASGTPAGSAGQVGHMMLKNPEVAQAVQAGVAASLKDAELTKAGVLEAIRRQVYGDIRCLFDAQGNLKPINLLTEAEAAIIQGSEIVLKNMAAGDGVVDTVAKVKLTNRAPYVELAARYFGIVDADDPSKPKMPTKLVIQVQQMPPDWKPKRQLAEEEGDVIDVTPGRRVPR